MRLRLTTMLSLDDDEAAVTRRRLCCFCCQPLNDLPNDGTAHTPCRRNPTPIVPLEGTLRPSGESVSPDNKD